MKVMARRITSPLPPIRAFRPVPCTRLGRTVDVSWPRPAVSRSADLMSPASSSPRFRTGRRRIRTGAELDALMQEWGVLVKKGDFGDLAREYEPD
jgi:hypothetical protein